MELIESHITVPEAIDGARADALSSAIDRACAEGAAGPIVLLGRAGVFCRGMDLEALVAGDAPIDPAVVAEGVAAFGRLLRTIRGARRPVIAAVDGAVLGGGVGIVAACDLVVATQQSTFGLPEVLVGLIPAVVLPALMERVSPQKARLLAMTAYSRSAEEAQALGIVDVVARNDGLEQAVRRAERSLCRPRPPSITALKRLSAEVAAVTFDEGIRVGVGETTRVLQRPDTIGAIRELLADEAS